MERTGATGAIGPATGTRRRLTVMVFVVHMLQSSCRVGGATLRGATCFVGAPGRIANEVALGRHNLLRVADRRTIAPPRPGRRVLRSLECSLRTSFPYGLLAPAPQGADTSASGVLDEDSIHVWMVQTEQIESRGDDFMAALRDTLSESELQRYQNSMATPKAREQALSFLVARCLLRCTLSRYCPQVAPQCWRFEVNAHGRPALCSELQKELLKEEHNEALQATLRHLSRLRFNLSHCAGMVVCAFAYGREVGIDSENVNAKRRIASIARRFFTTAETEELLSVPDDAQALTFSRLWTLKEAYVKARGLGISGVGLDNFEFKHVATFSEERPAGALSADLSKAGDAAADWQFVILDPPRARLQEPEGGGKGGARKRDATGQMGAARHAVSLAAGCAGGRPPAQLSIFKTVPLATSADELVALSEVSVLSSHAHVAGDSVGGGEKNSTRKHSLMRV